MLMMRRGAPPCCRWGGDDKDLRLRSVGSDVRKREAKRRIMDMDIKAGQPGTNLCRFTGVASSEMCQVPSQVEVPSLHKHARLNLWVVYHASHP
jgi:hypothetical protein